LFVDAIGRPDGSISLVYYLILWRNNCCTYRFPESRQVSESSECKAKPRTSH